MWVQGRLTRKQVTTGPGNFWPEDWSNMSKGSQRGAMKKWAEETKTNWTLRENSDAFTVCWHRREFEPLRVQRDS